MIKGLFDALNSLNMKQDARARLYQRFESYSPNVSFEDVFDKMGDMNINNTESHV